MAIIKCKMCGGDIQLSEDKTFGTCEYCGSTMTLPKVSDEQRAAQFNRGNHFRRQGEFDKALAVYERIVAEDDTDAEAHWCCALCRFGIEYVEDPATYEYIPTCHRASFDSFLEDVDYLAALEHSDGITRRQYQKDGAKIAEVQRGILATSQKEEPFDVFICYKETDDATKERTRDSLDAQEIYYNLTQEGYRVFFARITLEDKAGTEYEPYIFAALNSAKVMVVVGEKAEHFSAVWVKNEWSRFLSLMRKDRTKLLLPCYKNVDPYDLPEQLGVLQSYDMAKIGFMQDLIRGITKVLAKEEPKEAAQPIVQKVIQQSSGGANLAAQLKRGMQALEDKDWAAADSFFDKALDMDAECAEAFFGKALAAAQCVSGEELVKKRLSIQADQRKAQRITACEREDARINEVITANMIPGYLEASELHKLMQFDERTYSSLTNAWQTRIEEEKKYWDGDRNLSRAVRYSDGSFAERLHALHTETEKSLHEKLAKSQATDKKAAADTVKNYRDMLATLITAVEEKRAAAEKQREKDYQAICERQKKATSESEFFSVAAEFEQIGFWKYKDCAERAEQCRAEAARIMTAKEMAVATKKKKKKTIGIVAGAVGVFAVAAILLTVIVIIPGKKYKAAQALLVEGDFEAAYALFGEIGNRDAIASSKYDRALALINAGDYEAAYELLNRLHYKDSDSVLSSIELQYQKIILSRAQVGSYVIFGSFEQDNITANGNEDIEWLVLAKENDRILVISRYALDCQKYNTSKTDVTWETCSLRHWLNGAFVNAAFTDKERTMILSYRKSSMDKVFLLSVGEAKEYFKSDESRLCAPTDYAIAQGAWTSDTYKTAGKYTCCWWLRSPGVEPYLAAFVYSDGPVQDFGHYVNNDEDAVRPALWIEVGT